MFYDLNNVERDVKHQIISYKFEGLFGVQQQQKWKDVLNSTLNVAENGIGFQDFNPTPITF